MDQKPITSTPPVASQAVAQPSATNASTASASLSQKTMAAGEPTSSTHFNSMNDLKEKAPKVYQAMMVGIAQSICKEMQEAQARLKQIQREGRRDS